MARRRIIIINDLLLLAGVLLSANATFEFLPAIPPAACRPLALLTVAIVAYTAWRQGPRDRLDDIDPGAWLLGGVPIRRQVSIVILFLFLGLLSSVQILITGSGALDWLWWVVMGLRWLVLALAAWLWVLGPCRVWWRRADPPDAA